MIGLGSVCLLSTIHPSPPKAPTQMSSLLRRFLAPFFNFLPLPLLSLFLSSLVHSSALHAGVVPWRMSAKTNSLSGCVGPILSIRPFAGRSPFLTRFFFSPPFLFFCPSVFHRRQGQPLGDACECRLLGEDSRNQITWVVVLGSFSRSCSPSIVR